MGWKIDSRNRVWNWVAKLHRLAGRYDNHMPNWFLAPIAGLKLPGATLLDFNYLCTYDLSGPVHNVLDACISITRANGRGLGPVKCHQANRRMPFGAQKTRCKGGFMHKSPRGRFQGQYCGGWRSRCIKELVRPARPAPPPPHYKTY